jgi:hypothetical protein
VQRVSSLAPGSGLASGTLCQAVNRGGAAPAGSQGRCDENSPHCYGGRQGEKAHRRNENLPPEAMGFAGGSDTLDRLGATSFAKER